MPTPPKERRRTVKNVSTSEATKDKINSLLGKFTSFESEMKEGTRQRREKDEHELEKLRVEIVALEKMLVAETAHRVETAKALQSWSEEEACSIRAELFMNLQERLDGLDERVGGVHTRIDNLDEELAHQQETIPADIERRGALLTEKLTAFRALFEEERISRLEREAAISKRVATHESQVAEDCDTERTKREQQYQEIKAILERSVDQRKKRVERFNAMVEREITKLKNSIARETVIREKEDDEIVHTLTKYTEKLQNSLRVINTTEDQTGRAPASASRSAAA